MTDQLTLWLHLLAITVFVGSAVTVLVVLLPMAARISSPAEKQQFLAQGLKSYNPLSIGALGVLIMTGAFNLTSYKQQLGPQFFALLGGVLGLKLLLVFVLILVSTSATLGMGHRLVRIELRGEVFDPQKLPGLLKRIQLFTVLSIALSAGVMWVSMEMSERVKPSTAGVAGSLLPQSPRPGRETGHQD